MMRARKIEPVPTPEQDLLAQGVRDRASRPVEAGRA